MLALSKTNYPPALLSWLANTLQMGFLGEIQFLVGAASGNTGYRQELMKWGVPDAHMHTTLALAEAAIVADRNDVLVVLPGTYTSATRLAWDKDHTHLVGLGGPNTGGDYTLPGVALTTATGTVVETIDVTGDRCNFHNVQISNIGNAATALAALNVDGWGCYFKNVSFQGIMAATQGTTAACCSLSIDRLGHFPIFEDCIIGQNQWTVRSAGTQGHLRFIGTSAPAPGNGRFSRCQFLSLAQTDTCSAIYIVASGAIDRTWLFEDCTFSNFWTSWADDCTYVINDDYAGTHTIILKRCTAEGYTYWGDTNGLETDMPLVATGGGLTKFPSGASGS